MPRTREDAEELSPERRMTDAEIADLLKYLKNISKSATAVRQAVTLVAVLMFVGFAFGFVAAMR